MRLTLEFDSEDPIVLPIQYNYYIQSFLYRHISPELGKFLHDKGFTLGKRTFKMFTFSRLQGNYRITNDKISFTPPIRLTISSPLGRFVSELGNTLLKGDNLELVRNKIHVESIRVHPELEIKDGIKIRMLSPVVVYSTLMTIDGRKKTYYYSPKEDEFADLVDRNLRKKFEALYGRKTRARKLKLKTRWISDAKIVKYRGTVIKGYLGKFELDGNKKLLKLAYDTGIGSKNSQGFGMFEIV